MPLYEYECTGCGNRFDRLSSMAAADEAVCPRCDSGPARRLLSVIGGLAGRSADPAPTCGAGACGHCA